MIQTSSPHFDPVPVSRHVLATYKTFRPDTYGGIPLVIHDLARGMRPAYSTTILTCANPGPFTPHLCIDEIAVERVRSFAYWASMPLSPGYLQALHQAAANADLIAHHAPFPYLDLAVRLGLTGKKPLVCHWHADLVDFGLAGALLNRMSRRTLDRSAAIIVSSPSVIDRSVVLGAYRAKCAVIPFGIDLASWTDLDAEDAKVIAGLRAAHPRLVVACGRLVPYKGFDVLIEAATRMRADVTIIGSGPAESRLKARIEQLGLSGRVNLVGSLPHRQLRQWLTAASVFAFPSVTAAETFGLAQLEAMACGTPVVNTGLATGTPDVARHGIEGLTVPPHDADALAIALSRILDDTSLRAEFSAAARARVAEAFDGRRFVTDTAAVYDRALSDAFV